MGMSWPARCVAAAGVRLVLGKLTGSKAAGVYGPTLEGSIIKFPIKPCGRMERYMMSGKVYSIVGLARARLHSSWCTSQTSDQPIRS